MKNAAYITICALLAVGLACWGLVALPDHKAAETPRDGAAQEERLAPDSDEVAIDAPEPQADISGESSDDATEDVPVAQAGESSVSTASASTVPAGETAYDRSIRNIAVGDVARLPTDIELALLRVSGDQQDPPIADIALDDGELVVRVDVSDADIPDGQTAGDVAVKRASQIAAAILSLPQYGSLWNTITFDFGAVGTITCSKRDLANDTSGWYFSITEDSLEGGSQPTTWYRALPLPADRIG